MKKLIIPYMYASINNVEIEKIMNPISLAIYVYFMSFPRDHVDNDEIKNHYNLSDRVFNKALKYLKVLELIK